MLTKETHKSPSSDNFTGPWHDMEEWKVNFLAARSSLQDSGRLCSTQLWILSSAFSLAHLFASSTLSQQRLHGLEHRPNISGFQNVVFLSPESDFFQRNLFPQDKLPSI